MPQFDIFFYFNSILFFLISFIGLYLLLSFVLMPKLLSILKLRKQKLDFLYKISYIYDMRLRMVNLGLFDKNLKILVKIVKGSFFK